MEIKRIEERLGAKLRAVELAETLENLYLDVSDYAEYVERMPVLFQAYLRLLEKTLDKYKNIEAMQEEYEKFEINLPKPTSKKEEAIQAHSRILKLEPIVAAGQQAALDMDKEVVGGAMRIMEIPLYVNPSMEHAHRRELKQLKKYTELETFDRRCEAMGNILLHGVSGDIEKDHREYGRWFGMDLAGVRRDIRKFHDYLLDHLREIAEVGEITTIGKISFRAKDGWFQVRGGKEGHVISQQFKLLRALMENMKLHGSKGLEKSEAWDVVFRSGDKKIRPAKWKGKLQTVVKNLRTTLGVKAEDITFKRDSEYIEIKR